MGCIHIYCGDGKGKTTAAAGLAVRAAGSGMKVLFVQFFKNGSSGEIKVMQKIKNITCLNSSEHFGRFINMTDEEKQKITICYGELFLKAFNMAKNFDMIVLDEAISLCNHKIISTVQLIDFLQNNKNYCEIILTGRNPKQEICDIADYISHMEKIKHPFDFGVAAREGIEF